MDGESIKGMALQPELLLRAEQLLLGPLGECLLSATGSTSFFAGMAFSVIYSPCLQSVRVVSGLSSQLKDA